MKTKLISRLGYKEFYKKSESMDVLVKQIHLESALEFLVLINKNEHLLYQNEHSEISFILREWIPDTSEDFKTNFIRVFIEHSERKNQPFIAVDLGSLNSNIFESELFGYAKGAFTDAKTDTPGRFEMAQNGTIFLDEIGEMPMELQVKLLRVLQEREIERIV